MWPAIALAAAAGASALGNYMGNKSDADRASAAYDKITGLAQSAGAQNEADIKSYGNLINNMYGNDASQYSNALAKFLNSPVYQNEGFSYGTRNADGTITPYTASDFMDPYANQRADAAMQAIANASASNGSRFSSDYISRVGAKQQALASEEWEKAYNKLMQDRQMALSEYNTNSQNAWNNYNANNARNQYAVDAYGNARNQYVSGLGDAMSAGLQNRNAVLQTQANAIAGSANAQQGTSGWNLLSALGGAGANFLGSYFGGK